MGPKIQKSHAVWQSLSSRAEELRTFPKKYFLKFRPFIFLLGVLFAVCLLLAIFCSWHTFWRFQCTRKDKSSLGSTENPYFEELADLWHIWPYSQIQGPYSHMQSGASSESSVGDTSNWILFLWSIVIIPCLCFRSATLHSGQNIQKHGF